MAIRAKRPRIAILMDCQVTGPEDYFFFPLAAGFFAGFLPDFFFSATEVHLRSVLGLNQFCLCHRFVTRKSPAGEFFVLKIFSTKKFPFDQPAIPG
jgi:hypothetical protein